MNVGVTKRLQISATQRYNRLLHRTRVEKSHLKMYYKILQQQKTGIYGFISRT